MIENMEELQRMVANVGIDWDWKQQGQVNVTYYGSGLVLFSYGAKAQYDARWNWFERASRGLILDSETGEVVARPFDKFFNWTEDGRRPEDGATLEYVSEKMDGSLGILYRLDGEYKIATRGSLESYQALWATDFLNKTYNLTGLPENLTLLFEIIMPGNRIVVDYGKRTDLVLIGARDRFTSLNTPWFSKFNEPTLFDLSDTFGFSMPKLFNIRIIPGPVDYVLDNAKKLDANNEGFVLHFSDDSIWKIKGDRYVEIHRLLYNTSYKRILDMIQAGTYQETMATIPADLKTRVDEIADEITDEVHKISGKVYAVYIKADPGSKTRKEFALWVKKNHKDIAPFLFARYDGYDFRPMIFKRLRKRGRKIQ